MSLTLLMPLGLLALGGLLLPLLIHLIRRTEQTAIDFPALRWLRQSVRPRRRIRFDDIGLLLVRLLLLALIAVLLAMPVVTGEWRDPRHWVAVADAVDLNAARRQLNEEDAEWRWLAPGFPTVDAPPPAAPQDFSSLLREFDATRGESDRMTVFVPEVLSGLDAERLQLAHDVDWRIIAGSAPEPAASDPEPRRVILRTGSSPVSGAAYLRAAVTAWQDSEPARWSIEEQAATAAMPEPAAWLIWLDSDVPDELTAWVRAGGHALIVDPDAATGSVVWRDAQGRPLASNEALGAGHLVRLLKPLQPESFPAVLEPGFPARLQDLLAGPAAPPTQAWATSVRPARDDDLSSVVTTPLSPWLALLVAMVFLVERVVATRRRAVP